MTKIDTSYLNAKELLFGLDIIERLFWESYRHDSGLQPYNGRRVGYRAGVGAGIRGHET